MLSIAQVAAQANGKASEGSATVHAEPVADENANMCTAMMVKTLVESTQKQNEMMFGIVKEMRAERAEQEKKEEARRAEQEKKEEARRAEQEKREDNYRQLVLTLAGKNALADKNELSGKKRKEPEPKECKAKECVVVPMQVMNKLAEPVLDALKEMEETSSIEEMVYLRKIRSFKIHGSHLKKMVNLAGEECPTGKDKYSSDELISILYKYNVGGSKFTEWAGK